MQSGADTTLKNRFNQTALDVADDLNKQQLQPILENFLSKPSSRRKTDAKFEPKHSKKQLQSDANDDYSKVERVKSVVSDVKKTPTATKRRVDDVTSRMWRLETKQALTDKQIKEIRATVVNRVQKLEKEVTKEKAERAYETAYLQRRVAELEKENAGLSMRIETEMSYLMAKIRQVASEHTVFEGRFTMTRQPNAVHVGES